MNKILDFLKRNRYAIIWTACYFILTWAILRFLFNFDVLRWTHWAHLAHVQLHGFPGLVFGILILSALPLYVATTSVIVRTGKPLITVSTPKILKPVPTETETKTQTNETDAKIPDSEPEPIKLPNDIPSELRPAYLRARQNLGRLQTSTFNAPRHNNNQTPTPTVQDDTDIPLPVDFDIPIDFDNFTPDTPQSPDTPIDIGSAPIFKDIDFDTTFDIVTPPIPEIETPTGENDAIIDYLNKKSIKFDIQNELIITATHAIASHTDNAMWIADADNWFAAGKQKKSPITELIIATQDGTKKPVLYLGATNIMDLENLSAAWSAMGISIIEKPEQLSE